MTNTRNLIAFIVIISAAFVYICYAIPQVEGRPAAAETEIGDSPEELVVAGKRIFMSDRSQCLTCHSLGEDSKARCPNQEGIGERAAKQKGNLSPAEYLVESVYDPNAFIVSGYPANQMTPVNKPPIALSHDEILALLAYLNTMGSKTDAEFLDALKKAQDPWRKGLREPGVVEEQEQLPILAGDVQRGWEVFQKQSCIQCHRVAGEGREVGPELTAIGASQTAAYMLESVLDPSAVIVKGYLETIIIWEDEDEEPLRGTAIAWIPNKEHPTGIKLAVLESDKTLEREVDLAEAAYVGDTIVGVEIDEEFEAVCGEYVEGEKDTGVTLRILQKGQWVERRIPAEQIEFVSLPMSPMPANFAELVTPRDVYDLLAYLLAQKGDKK
jgi:putative heme-binding domain-containing protein